jgi:hypothetical protein
LEATPTTNATVLAMTSQFNLTAAAETAIAAAVTDTPSGPSIDIGAVQMTATALAIALGQAPTQDAGGGATPTLEVIGDTPVGPLPTALPDTGLFDDLATGGAGGLGGLALVMLGLVGVIAVSRRLRVANN